MKKIKLEVSLLTPSEKVDSYTIGLSDWI